MSQIVSQEDLWGLIVAFVLQLIIALVCFAIFSLIRSKYQSIYQPKLLNSPKEKKPPTVENGFLSWIINCISLNELDYSQALGFDSIMFLRFLNFCWKFFMGIWILTIPLIIIYYYAPNVTGMNGLISPDADEKTTIYQLSFLTMNNVNSSSNLFFLFTVFTWIISAYAYYLLYTLWNEYLVLRREYFISDEFRNSYNKRVLLLNNLPDTIETKESIRQFMDSLGLKHKIQDVTFGRDFEELPKLVLKHSKLIEKLEGILTNYYVNCDKFQLKSEQEKTKAGGEFKRPIEKKQDAIKKAVEELKDLETKIYALQSSGDELYKQKANAFVLMPSITAAHDAQILVNNRSRFYKMQSPKITPCADSEDIVWENVGLPKYTLAIRSILGLLITIFMTIGWTLIVAFVASLTKIETLSKISKSLGEAIESSPAGVVLLQSVIAPVALLLLNMLIPTFFRMITLMQGLVSFTDIEKSVLSKYFYFMLYQIGVFIGVSALIPVITSFIDSGKFPNVDVLLNQIILGFISAATFYMTIIAVSYSGYAIDILQIGPLAMDYIMPKIFNLTPRKISISKAPKEFDFMIAYGTLMITFVISIAYSVIAPLIAIFGGLLFVIAYVTMKYQLFYVFKNKIQCGGDWWPKLFTLLCICIGIFQFLTFGSILIITSKSSGITSKIAAILVVILVVVSYVFWYINMRLFTRLCNEVGDINEPSIEPLELDCHIYDPCIGKSLKKIWVDEKYADRLLLEYIPEYESTDDYITKKQLNSEKFLKNQILIRQRASKSKTDESGWDTMNSSNAETIDKSDKTSV